MEPKQKERSVAVATPLGEDVLLLKRMTGFEELGRMFEFHLEMLSTDAEIKMEDMLGQNVTVRLQVSEEETRYFNGFVTRFGQVAGAGDLVPYEATVRPWLWFLTRTADCRIFQEMSAPDIIKQIFRDRGFTNFEDALDGSYRTREYCVQYRETDFNFVSRLMEEEGIYYYFTHEDGKHHLVLADAYGSHDKVPEYEQIPYFPPTERASRIRDHIDRWSVSREVQPGIYALNDFDFERPKASLLVKSSVSRGHAGDEFEVFDYPGEYFESGDGSQYAQVRIEELQASYQRVSGGGSARGMTSGALFELTDFPREDQNIEYLTVSVNHQLVSPAYVSRTAGEAGEPYNVSFTAIDARQPFRPSRLTPKPVVQGPQTAIVVGSSGEEIWTDKHGRVKVQFHWDRESKADENSSCWIRVAQMVAGKSWGGIQIPRIGQEVLVEFLEGDPDRPIITGRIYNGTNKVPYTLPDNQTISGMKSNSSKGGGGFNELRFEDKKEEEQIFLHGEKNLDIRVKNDRFETIDHDRHLVVENDKKEKVSNERHEEVASHHYEKIGGERHLKVVAKQAMEVGESLSVTVKGDVHEVYKANHGEQVTNDYYLKADNIVIEASTNITIKVGQSYIAIEAGGIKIATMGDIVVESTGQTSVTATSGLTLESPAQAELKSTSTTVKGDAMMTIKGGMVQIN